VVCVRFRFDVNLKFEVRNSNWMNKSDITHLRTPGATAKAAISSIESGIRRAQENSSVCRIRV
jgi:ADP-ribosylglycohydrolase